MSISRDNAPASGSCSVADPHGSVYVPVGCPDLLCGHCYPAETGERLDELALAAGPGSAVLVMGNEAVIVPRAMRAGGEA